MEKRYAKGLVANAFYTMSKTLTDVGSLSYYSRAAKARAGHDVRHNFTFMATYELPFGKGRSYMNNSRVLDYILGGWDLTWTHTLQSGQPISVGMSNSPYKYILSSKVNLLTTVEQARTADWNIGPHRFPASAQNPYLKYDAFTYPAAYTTGSLGSNVFESPGVNWMQFALSKSWTVVERLKLILRVDGHNLPFKQPQYSTPSSTYNRNSPSTFGTFTSTRGAWSEFGTAQSNMQVSIRGEF